jgi:HPt (histidine-containing phosphotransfer) domain-containing protein
MCEDYEDYEEYDFDITDADIPEIDAQICDELYCGETDLFVGALKSFATHIPASLSKLSNVSDYEHTLHEYVITVHAIKGLCAGVGALEISNLARTLELSAKSGDFLFVQANNSALINKAGKLATDIQDWLSEKRFT